MLRKLIITEANFTDYFFPANENYKPKLGQILACWRAEADFIDGWIKRNVIELLCSNKNGAQPAVQIMRKLVHATDNDAVRVLREMAEDLVKGISVDEVVDKPYHFVIEQFYWTHKEYIPDDPHWEYIHCVDTRECDKVEETI